MSRSARAQSRPIRILSIDGGGIRGVIPARILVELERVAGRPISELFDIVAGTSTGGIVAVGLTVPDAEGRPALTAEQVVDFFVREGPAIFPDTSVLLRQVRETRRRAGGKATAIRRSATTALARYLGPDLEPVVLTAQQRIGAALMPRKYGNARYLPHALEDALKRGLGDVRISDALADLVITAYDMRAGRALAFRSSDARDGSGPNPTMVAAARATSAAPTYFPPKRIATDARDLVLIDGAFVANNPVALAYHEALRREHRSRRDTTVLVVSLGTGRPPEHVPTYGEIWSRGWLRLAAGMLNVVFDGTSEMADEMVGSLVRAEPGSRYWRFQAELSNCSTALDDATPANIRALLRIAEGVISDRRHDLAEIADLLKAVPADEAREVSLFDET